MESPDNIVVTPWGDLWFAEDEAVSGDTINRVMGVTPDGQVYRAWVLSGESWIPLGPITPDADGSARLIAEDAALAGPIDRVELTLESPPAPAAPTGRVIIIWSATQ